MEFEVMMYIEKFIKGKVNFNAVKESNLDKIAGTMSISFCKQYSPRKNWDIGRKEIKLVMKEMLKQLMYGVKLYGDLYEIEYMNDRVYIRANNDVEAKRIKKEYINSFNFQSLAKMFVLPDSTQEQYAKLSKVDSLLFNEEKEAYYVVVDGEYGPYDPLFDTINFLSFDIGGARI